MCPDIQFVSSFKQDTYYYNNIMPRRVRRRRQQRRSRSTPQHLEHQVSVTISQTTGEFKITGDMLKLDPRPCKIMRVHIQFRQPDVQSQILLFSFSIANTVESGVDFTSQSRTYLMSAISQTAVLRNTASADFGFCTGSTLAILITQRGAIETGSDSIPGVYNVTAYVAYKMQQVRVIEVYQSRDPDDVSDEELARSFSPLALTSREGGEM